MKRLVLLVSVLVWMAVPVSYSSDKGICPKDDDKAFELPKRGIPAPPNPGFQYVGTISMRVSLSDTGQVCAVELVKGIRDDLDKESLSLMRREVFQPILLGDKPIPGKMLVQRDYWSDGSGGVYSQNADAFSDEIPPQARLDEAPDIALIAHENLIENDTYKNSYFNISFVAPRARFVPPSLEAAEGTGRLTEAISTTENSKERYSIAVVADRLTKYPKLSTLGQYLDMVGQQANQRSGWDNKFPYEISGMQFEGMVFKVSDGLDSYHYRGVLTTVANGYFLSLDIAATTKEQVLKIASSVEFDQKK